MGLEREEVEAIVAAALHVAIRRERKLWLAGLSIALAVLCLARMDLLVPPAAPLRAAAAAAGPRPLPPPRRRLQSLLWTAPAAAAADADAAPACACPPGPAGPAGPEGPPGRDGAPPAWLVDAFDWNAARRKLTVRAASAELAGSLVVRGFAGVTNSIFVGGDPSRGDASTEVAPGSVFLYGPAGGAVVGFETAPDGYQVGNVTVSGALLVDSYRAFEGPLPVALQRG